MKRREGISELLGRLVPAGHGVRVRWGIGAVVVLGLIAVAVAILIAAFRPDGGSVVIESAGMQSGSTEQSVLQSDSVRILVHVLGAVQTPGIYQLSPGARVIDAVAAAGGFTAEADRGTVNLARILTDGEQLAVPEVGESPPEIAAAGGGGGALVNVNTATLSELEALPRVGPTMAQRIIDWRTANGRFAVAEDLLAVPGIGAKTLDGFRDQLAF